jgi:hypothetical protein
VNIRFIRERNFDKQLQRITKSYRRMDELDEAIEWALARKPDAFFNIFEDFYVWKTERLISDIPQLRILYRWDKPDTVILISVEVITE